MRLGTTHIVSCLAFGVLSTALPGAVRADQANQIKITGVTAHGWPNERTGDRVPADAVDGDQGTYTWTTQPDNPEQPSYLGLDLGATRLVCRVRLWKDNLDGRIEGTSIAKDLVIQVTTDLGPMENRSWTNVSGLATGYDGEVLVAASVNSDGTVIDDAHDSVNEGHGWASLTFNPQAATGVRICFSKEEADANHYKVHEFEAYAPCDGAVTMITAGSDDNFMAPTEPASPGPRLQACATELGFTFKPFDDTSTDNWFGHTFIALPRHVCAATLELSLRASAEASNDVIGLEVSGLDPCIEAYRIPIVQLPESGGTWNMNQSAIFTLDLSNLVPDVNNVTDILSYLSDGDLDVRVSDDTAVDYIKLTLVCEVPTCVGPETTIAAGLDDDFAPPDEPATPGPRLQGCATELGFTFKDFDSNSGDDWFGHTITGIPPQVCAATLELRLRALASTASNDVIGLEITGLGPCTEAYRIPIIDLPEAGGLWGSGNTAVFSLDLANLLPDTNGVTNILASLADGDLDIRVADDTAVDYINLIVRRPPGSVMIAGFDDNFAAPNEPASPGQRLQDCASELGFTFKQFDDTATNNWFGHTFTGIPACVCAATLELRLRGITGSSNDVIALEVTGLSACTEAYRIPIMDLPEAGGSWEPGASAIFRLDLADLVPDTNNVTNIIGHLGDSDLDVRVADDTQVDYMKLWVTCTSTPVDVESVPFRSVLAQNFPNPFNPRTRISYTLAEGSPVALKVYNVGGRLVRILVDEARPTGFHSVVWDGRDALGRQLMSGVYFYRITASGLEQTKKMVLLK